jgi:hypothetical protein
VAPAPRQGGPGQRAHAVPAPRPRRPCGVGPPARRGELRPAARAGPRPRAAVSLGLHGLRGRRPDGLRARHRLGRQRHGAGHQRGLPHHARRRPAQQPGAQGFLDPRVLRRAGQGLDGVRHPAAGLARPVGRHAGARPGGGHADQRRGGQPGMGRDASPRRTGNCASPHSRTRCSIRSTAW